MTVVIPSALTTAVTPHPYPLLFATVGGKYLYDIPSLDLSYEVGGAYQLPLEELVGLELGEETRRQTRIHGGLSVTMVTHEIKKLLLLLLTPNGEVLEFLYSPLVLYTTPAHEQLKAIAPGCFTCHHSYHYTGLAATQWHRFTATSALEPLLLTYRTLLTGIHLMRSGTLETSLSQLAQGFQLSHLIDLVSEQRTKQRPIALSMTDIAHHSQEYQRLQQHLATASQTSLLPETPTPTAKAELHHLLLQVRLTGLADPKGSQDNKAEVRQP